MSNAKKDFLKRALEGDGQFAIAYALLELESAILFGAKEIGKEGVPGMGALEFVASKLESVASSIGEVAQAIENRGE